MRRSREDTADTRQSIVAEASRLIRARGIAQVSVADVMEGAGLTVGGFYRHFGSKEELVAEAIDAASRETAAMHASSTGEPPRRRAARILDTYLSMAHRDHPEQGCPVAALCSEVAHEGARTKDAFVAAVERLLGVVGEILPGESQRARDRRWQTAASIVGAMALARATNDAAVASELLGAVRRGLAQRTTRAPRPRKVRARGERAPRRHGAG